MTIFHATIILICLPFCKTFSVTVRPLACPRYGVKISAREKGEYPGTDRIKYLRFRHSAILKKKPLEIRLDYDQFPVDCVAWKTGTTTACTRMHVSRASGSSYPLLGCR